MFNLSGSEMIFLLLIALVVLGPEKLPEAVRRFGKAYGEFKKVTSGFQSELRSALDEPMKEMRETADQLRKSANLDFNFEPDRVDGDSSAPPAASEPAPTSIADAASAAGGTDAVTTEAPIDLSAFGLGSPAPAPAPNGWNPVAPAPATPPVAPTPSGWSPVAANDVLTSSNDEVAPG